MMAGIEVISPPTTPANINATNGWMPVGSGKVKPTMAATVPPMNKAPDEPMLNWFAENMTDTDRPKKVNGMAVSTTFPIFLNFEIGPKNR